MKHKKIVRALDVAEKYINGKATKKEMKNAVDASIDASYGDAAHAALTVYAAVDATYASHADAVAYDAMIERQKVLLKTYGCRHSHNRKQNSLDDLTNSV